VAVEERCVHSHGCQMSSELYVDGSSERPVFVLETTYSSLRSANSAARVLGGAGGQEHHASALSSAASVLRSVRRRPGEQGVVLAGCEDGMVVGLDSVTASALWRVNVSTARNPRKSQQVLHSGKNSGMCSQVTEYSVVLLCRIGNPPGSDVQVIRRAMYQRRKAFRTSL
jgi:hypothetical protein